jgi:hypothetical protein
VSANELPLLAPSQTSRDIAAVDARSATAGRDISAAVEFADTSPGRTLAESEMTRTGFPSGDNTGAEVTADSLLDTELASPLAAEFSINAPAGNEITDNAATTVAQKRYQKVYMYQGLWWLASSEASAEALSTVLIRDSRIRLSQVPRLSDAGGSVRRADSIARGGTTR